MEASALHAPSLGRLNVAAPLLRLRSDEQLLALFRAGSEEAFGVIHDRYRQRLFAYVRQMLSAASRQDAEDVLQDVFVRAYGALRADDRELNLRAWLYRVAHNRCIDHLRRPVPAAAEIFETSRKPLHDPIVEAQRRDDLERLVRDIARLPDQQRSALLMREIDGLSYQDLAGALDVSVPAVKSLLVRARVGLVEAAEARDADCADIRRDLLAAYDRGVKASSRARRHMRECGGCREYRTRLRGVRRSFHALAPAGGLGPLALLANVFGLGGAGGGAAAGSSAAAGGTVIATGTATGVAGVTACKVAAVVCTAVVTAGGAAGVKSLAEHQRAPAAKSSAAAASAPAAQTQAATTHAIAAPAVETKRSNLLTGPAADRAAERRKAREREAKRRERAQDGAPASIAPPGTPETAAEEESLGSGGATAPIEQVEEQVPAVEQPAGDAGTTVGDQPPATAPSADESAKLPPAGTTAPGTGGTASTPPSGTLPPEH